jgi:hypothetical protein
MKNKLNLKFIFYYYSELSDVKMWKIIFILSVAPNLSMKGKNLKNYFRNVFSFVTPPRRSTGISQTIL